MGSLRHWIVPAVLAFAVPAAALGPIWGPTPIPDGYNYNYMLYDTDGVAGARKMGSDFYNTGTLDRYLGDGTHLVNAVQINSSTGPVSPELLGLPYWLRLESPIFGCVLFSDIFGAEYPGLGNRGYRPYFVIPVSFSEHSLSQVPGGCGTFADSGFGIRRFVLLAPNTETPTVALDVKTGLEAENRQVDYLIEYLPGNAMEAVGFEEVTVDLAELLGGGSLGSLVWGHPGTLSEQVPVGPLRITASMEGYASDSILLDGRNDGSCNEWYAVLTPLLARPEDMAEGLEPTLQMQQMVNVPALLGSSSAFEGCTPGGSAASASDPNEDGVLDAADLTAATSELPEEETE